MSKLSKLLGRAVALLLLGAAAPPVFAADLYDTDRPRVSSPYDDPRYRDIYGQPAPRYVDRGNLPPPPVVYPERTYTERTYTDRRTYLAPMPPPTFIDRRHWVPGYTDRCVPRELIRDNLKADGWSGFHDLDFQGPVATVNAYRPDGHLYRLKVDRCSGDLVSTRLLDRTRDVAGVDGETYDEAPRGSSYDGRAYRY